MTLATSWQNAAVYGALDSANADAGDPSSVDLQDR
jgi:hypothetical protein